MQTKVYILEEIDAIAQQIIDNKPQSVILFNGEMGAGKTTLIKAIAKKMGVVEVTNSPTYLLVNEYKTTHNKTLYHFDAYRLKNEEEAYAMGFEEYLDSGNTCFVEWPERMQHILPLNCTTITIEKLSENKRQLTID